MVQVPILSGSSSDTIRFKAPILVGKAKTIKNLPCYLIKVLYSQRTMEQASYSKFKRFDLSMLALFMAIPLLYLGMALISLFSLAPLGIKNSH